MAWGYFFGCHQMSSRSFFFKGYQAPVCARCTGVFLGQGIAIIFIFFFREYIAVLWSIAAMGLMLLDWFVQRVELMQSSNFRRLVTGVMGGYGFVSLLFKVLSYRFLGF